MKAIIATGGKQYLVEPGTILDIELIDGEKGNTVEFKEVLFVGPTDRELTEGAATISQKLGTPYVTGAVVTAKIVNQVRGKKLIAFKKIRRHGKQWKKGHRQDLTRVRIEELTVQ
jgi:large subunit ribosomal protein L21